jgi:hypothetical protein
LKARPAVLLVFLLLLLSSAFILMLPPVVRSSTTTTEYTTITSYTTLSSTTTETQSSTVTSVHVGTNYSTEFINSVVVSNSNETEMSPPYDSAGNRYIPVGAFLYEWYGYNVTSGLWTGGLGTSHWNDTSNDVIGSGPKINIVKDTPSIGFYASDDNNTLSWQLSNMQKAGISVIVASWWGVGNESGVGNNAKEDAAINNAVLNLFHYVESTKNLWNFRIAIMVEPFNSTDLSTSDYNNLYSYIENVFYKPFNDITVYWQGKPLLLGFNPQYLPALPAASIFTLRTEGGVPNPVNWYFWEGGSYDDSSGPGAQIKNYEYAPGISHDGEVGLAWRYDDHWQRPNYMIFDQNGSQGMYNYEWNYTIQHRSSVNLVLLYGWNEYHERTELEPHYDFTIKGSVNFVGTTGYWVKVLESTPDQSSLSSGTQTTIPGLAWYAAGIVAILAMVLAAFAYMRHYK